MKFTNVFTIAALLAISLSATHCTAGKDYVPSTEETLIRNGWGVEYYFQQLNVTNEFSEYRITFRSNGIINCRKENELISGSWNRVVDASQSEIIVINISTTNTVINKLNGSWTLLNLTSQYINLEDGQQPAGSLMRIRVKP